MIDSRPSRNRVKMWQCSFFPKSAQRLPALALGGYDKTVARLLCAGRAGACADFLVAFPESSEQNVSVAVLSCPLSVSS